MNFRESNGQQVVKFGSIPVTLGFIHEREIYMRVEPFEKNQAVNMRTGSINSFDDEEEVIRISVTLNWKYWR